MTVSRCGWFVGWCACVSLFALACGAEDDCEFSSCGVGGTGSGFPLSGSASARVELDCATSSVSCTGIEQDAFGRVVELSCTYSNGRTFTCSDITFDSLGRVTGGTCAGEGATCTLP